MIGNVMSYLKVNIFFRNNIVIKFVCINFVLPVSIKEVNLR